MNNLEAIKKEIEKKYSKGCFGKLSDIPDASGLEIVPTGIMSIDAALGVGGIPRGRIVEISGPASSGKTTMALTLVANAQKMGGNAAYIDSEHALDVAYAKSLGVDVDNLWLNQPDYGEMALDILDSLVVDGGADIIIVDSVAALVPKAELDANVEDNQMGLQARLMSKIMRMTTGKIAKHRAIVVYLNQIREKIGVTFGPSETLSGGNALKFYSSIRIDIRRIGQLKSGEDLIGNRTKVKIVKNKVAPPFKEAEVNLEYGKGFDSEADFIELLCAHGVVEAKGSWYKVEGEQIGQGKESVANWLAGIDVTRRQELENKIKEKLGISNITLAKYGE